MTRVTFDGHCPLCEQHTTFVAERDTPLDVKWHGHWFREALRCSNCKSIPRQRALAHVLQSVAPSWREFTIHESSPGGGGVSAKLRRECAGYVASQYDPDRPFGSMHESGRWRNEDLEAQTFADNSFDVVVTQDVFEHVFHPGRAAREIARTLKPGGFCVMTVPCVQAWQTSRRRAGLVGGAVTNLLPEQYHGNPVGDGKSLVTIDWGYDIAVYLTAHAGIPFSPFLIVDMSLGIRDEHNVVLVARKMPVPDLGEG